MIRILIICLSASTWFGLHHLLVRIKMIWIQIISKSASKWSGSVSSPGLHQNEYPYRLLVRIKMILIIIISWSKLKWSGSVSSKWSASTWSGSRNVDSNKLQQLPSRDLQSGPQKDTNTCPYMGTAICTRLATQFLHRGRDFMSDTLSRNFTRISTVLM